MFAVAVHTFASRIKRPPFRLTCSIFGACSTAAPSKSYTWNDAVHNKNPDEIVPKHSTCDSKGGFFDFSSFYLEFVLSFGGWWWCLVRAKGTVYWLVSFVLVNFIRLYLTLEYMWRCNSCVTICQSIKKKISTTYCEKERISSWVNYYNVGAFYFHIHRL